MTLQQLKQEAAALSDADRLELRAFLVHIERVDDPSNRHDLSARMQRLDVESISLDEFIRLNAPEGSQAL